MGAWYDDLSDEEHRKWVLEQKIFWVATAPLASQGHVNVSPKGRPSFYLRGNSSCWYVDQTGSGNETISHLYEPGNGRITVMFSAFEGPARILRLFGKGTVFERGSPKFRKLVPDGDDRILPGTRAIIWIDFHKVSTSCGFAVPFFSYEGERLELDEATYKEVLDDSEIDEKTGLESNLLMAWNTVNSLSIDALPGLKIASDLSIARPPAFDTYGTLKDGKIEPPMPTLQTEVRRLPMLVLTRVATTAFAFIAGLALAPLLRPAIDHGLEGLVKHL